MANRIYEFQVNSQSITISLGGKHFMTLPASASVNDRLSELALSKNGDTAAVYESERAQMEFTFLTDSILVSYSEWFEEDTPIYQSKLFKGNTSGIDLKGFDRAFTSQP